MWFRDRQEAGRRLAEALRGVPMERPLVLAIPRGGVEVGAALAESLGAELDVILSRKLRAPRQPELAIGAVGEDGRAFLSPRAGWLPRVTPEYVAEETRRQVREIQERSARVRRVRPPAAVEGRTVIVVDDGLATGATMQAALESLAGRGAREVIAAVPVAAPSSLERLRPACDRVVCLHAPADFRAVGQFYGRFEAVTDERVEELLGRFADRGAG